MQNYKNHRKMDWGWVVAFLGLFAFTILIIVDFFRQLGFGFQNFIDTLQMFRPLGVLIVFGRILLLKLRGYATKLQDRIIRQEVQFRHYVMTGKLLDSRITMKQMISLRFAGDSEFLDLCEKAASEGLEPKVIKQMVQEWKADEVRV